MKFALAVFYCCISNPDILLGALFPYTFTLSLMWQTKYHTCTKPDVYMYAVSERH